MRPLVAIVGRPNVGKSTLFNKLVGRRIALVEDVAGVTRDRHYGDGEWGGREIAYVDTGGFVPEGVAGANEIGRSGEKKKAMGGGVGGGLSSIMDDKVLLAAIRAQAQLAIEEAAAIIFVCDATEGLVPGDEDVARLLMRSGKPLFVVANKVDNDKREAELPHSEFYSLGVNKVYTVSAEHSRGLSELLDDLLEALPNAPRIAEVEEERPEDAPIRLAVVGRPNVGKSTLLNALLRQDRFISSSVPGTTHDAVDEELEYSGRKFVLTDTAGIRRQKAISAKIESFSVIRAYKALEDADVAVVLLDPTEPGVDQDAKIVGLAADRGRAVLLVVNKWDLVEHDEKKAEEVRDLIRTRLEFVPWAPVLFVSALEKDNTDEILNEAIRLHQQATTRLPTPDLNAFLQDVQDSQPAPLWRGFPVKMFFVAQIATRPITLAVSTNRPQAIVDSYRRFMMNRLRQRFGLEVPVRLVFKQKSGDRRPEVKSTTKRKSRS